MAHRSAEEPRAFPFGALCRVFDEFQHAVLLVDRTGTVVWANSAAIDSFGALQTTGDHPTTCCDLLSCGRNCLTSAARRSDRPLPERRVELPGGHVASVSAIPLRFRHPDLIALHVRLAAEPSAPATTPPDLDVRVLGRLRVSVGGELRDGEWLVQRPGQLLKYLICMRPRPVGPEQIAGALWPDRGPSAVANVRYFVHRLREHLEPHRPKGANGSLVQTRSHRYRLDPQRLRVDADRFETRVIRGLALLRRGEAAAAEAKLVQALEMYRGDFLAEDRYAEWAFEECGYLHDLAGQALRSVGEMNLEAGRLDAASRFFSRLAGLEPFDADIHERLIEVDLRRGHRTEAVRRYTALRARMYRAFGQEPGFDLQQVAARMDERG